MKKKINPHMLPIIKLANQKGLRVRMVGKELQDYAGMNDQAAKALGFPAKLDLPRTILIDRRMSIRKQEQTLKHEIIERPIMARQKKKDYWTAHLQAEKHENDSLKRIARRK